MTASITIIVTSTAYKHNTTPLFTYMLLTPPCVAATEVAAVVVGSSSSDIVESKTTKCRDVRHHRGDMRGRWFPDRNRIFAPAAQATVQFIG